MKPGTVTSLRAGRDDGPARHIAQILSDGQRHSRNLVRREVVEARPPEFFARLATYRHIKQSVVSKRNHWFSKALDGLIQRGWIERDKARPKGEDFQMWLNESGWDHFIEMGVLSKRITFSPNCLVGLTQPPGSLSPR